MCCTEACVTGSQERRRAQVVPVFFGGKACPHYTETHGCKIVECPVHPVISAWTAWSTCTKSCGQGAQSHTRTITKVAQHGGYVCPTSPRRTTATSRLVTSPPGPPAPSRPQLACCRFYELLAATAEALADRSSACRRQGPPRTAPSAASRRRPRAPWCPAPARPPPSRPIVAFSLGLGALKRALKSTPSKPRHCIRGSL